MSSLDDEKGTQLGKFFYNIEGSVIQQFDVSVSFDATIFSSCYCPC